MIKAFEFKCLKKGSCRYPSTWVILLIRILYIKCFRIRPLRLLSAPRGYRKPKWTRFAENAVKGSYDYEGAT